MEHELEEPGPAAPQRVPRPWRRKVLLHVGAILLGALAAVAILGSVPALEQQIGPVTLSADAATGAGRTRLLVPPLGTVVAETHPVPVTIDVALTQVDVERLGAVVDSFGSTALADEAEEGLRAMARRLAIRSLIAGAVVGAIAVALMPRRRWPYVFTGAVGGVTVVAAFLATLAVTFSVDAFAQPTFTGALKRAPIVIEALDKGQISLEGVSSRFRLAAERLSGLLALLARDDVDVGLADTVVLHISDVHSNPIGLQIARQLVTRFDVDVIVDTGDLMNFGLDLERRMARLVDDFDAPYIFVPGNHDTREVQRAVAALPNATLLDEETVEVAGIEFLGWGDPTYTNWNNLPPEEAAAARRAEASAVADAVAAADPDVLLVHDKRLAEASMGQVPLILSGHYHRQIRVVEDGTILLGVGSTGAAGLESYAFDTEMNYEAEIIYFTAGVPIAMDYVRFSGLGADFEISRTLLDEDVPQVGAGVDSTEPDEHPEELETTPSAGTTAPSPEDEPGSVEDQ